MYKNEAFPVLKILQTVQSREESNIYAEHKIFSVIHRSL